MYNKRGFASIMLGLMGFMFGLAIVTIFISPISSMLDIQRQSDNLNCKGYIHNGLNESNSNLAFNSTLDGGNSGDPLACLFTKLYVVYLMAGFLFGGLGAILGGRGAELFGLGNNELH
jgi:hypothetical protein